MRLVDCVFVGRVCVGSSQTGVSGGGPDLDGHRTIVKV